MPSHLHQFLVELLRERPKLVEHLMREVLRLRVPGRIVLRPGPTALSEIMPAEHASDAVFEVRALDDDRPRLGLIFEVQLERDDDKEFTWPLYVAGQRARLRSPVALVVMTPSRGTARWARRELDLDGSGGFTFAPRVLGPDEIPIVTEPAEARALPELAVLSVIAHRTDRCALNIARAAVDAARQLDDATARLYSDVVFANLARAARRKLEIEMGLENYEYQSEFAKKFIALGREEGREAGRRTGEVEASRSLLRAVAAARGLALTVAQLERIDACDDANVLQTWATRAATASEADQIF
jgi:hypothetical protein